MDKENVEIMGHFVYIISAIFLAVIIFFYIIIPIHYSADEAERWVGEWRCEEWKKLGCSCKVPAYCNEEGAIHCGALGEPCCPMKLESPDALLHCFICEEWETECVSRVWVEHLERG